MIAPRNHAVPRLLLVLLTSLALALPALHALAAPPPTEAEKLIMDTASEALETIRQHRSEFEAKPRRLYATIEERILPHFDFVSMSKLVLGKYWRRARPEQRRRFVEEFKTLLVRTYASALLKYSDSRLELLPSRKPSRPNRADVQTQALLNDGRKIAMDYRLYKRKDHWLVYDVRVEGVSLVINYRSSFRNEIAQKGGIAALIEKLEKLNRKANVG